MTETDLHKAINVRNSTEALELLETESGLAMARECDEDGNLPLHVACAFPGYGFIQVIEKLIDVFPKGVESKGKLGLLPLHCAAAHAWRKASLDLLISKYPEGLLCKDNTGCLPIHRAKDADIFGHLATVCPESLNVQNIWSHRPIMSWLTDQKVAKKRARTIETLVLIIAQKADEDKKKLQEEMIKIKDSLASEKKLHAEMINAKNADEDKKKLQEELVSEKKKFQLEMSKIKDALASVTKDLEYEKKMTNEARKIEKEFRTHLLDPENEAAAATIDTLKSFAGSLKTRLDLTKAKLQNNHPSANNNNNKPSLVQLMFASFIKDPDVSRSSLVHCIEMLDAELSSLEQQQGHQNMEENQEDAATRSNTGGVDVSGNSNQGVTETSADQSTPMKKRARVSIA